MNNLTGTLDTIYHTENLLLEKSSMSELLLKRKNLYRTIYCYKPDSVAGYVAKERLKKVNEAISKLNKKRK